MSVLRPRAFILPVVLVVIGLLAVTLGGFVFFVRAEVAGVRAERDAQQARLAAESGLQEVILALRKSRDDPTVWWDAQERFRNVLVWSEAYDRARDPVRKMGTRKEYLEAGTPRPAWRFSVVAKNLDGLPNTMRFGITPEAGKLNLNTASEDETSRLMQDVLGELGVENVPELTACLLDWLDEDDETRSGGAETDYYQTLRPGYKAKNGRLDTLEELLLIKGFSAAVLYGEDTNRNGILDRNEDDGAASFPMYDNGDGLLSQGLSTYVTVWSRESRSSTSGTGTPSGGTPSSGTPGTGTPGTGTPATGTPPGGAPGTGTGTSTGEKKPGGQKALTQQSTDDKDETGGGDAEPGAGESAQPEDTSGDESGQTTTATTGGTVGTGGTGTGTPQTVEGLVNIHAASVRVLRALIGDLDPQAPEKIVALRQEQDASALKSANWPVSSGAISAEAYAAIKDRLTLKSYQFHVEILGYADHTKVARRYEWIVEVRGPAVQVLYHRDLTSLGFAWPLDDDTVVVKQQ